jgi:predicted transport protein
MILFYNSKEFKEYKYPKEEEFEKDIVANSKLFFGQNTVYIDAKKKIESKSLGGAIPDGFLFDLADRENPEFYIVEAELSNHKFYDHIFPQITKFFAFYKNQTSHSELVDKLYKIITSDPQLKMEFTNLIAGKEIYKFIKDTLYNSQNILLIIDGEKKELSETFNTYSEWDAMVKYIITKKYTNNSELIYTMEPEFQIIEYVSGDLDEEGEEAREYTEDYHIDKTSKAVADIYTEIKTRIKSYDDTIAFNPTGHYIAIKSKKNVATFKFRKNKIKLIVKMPEEIVRSKIRFHKVISLSEAVQKFYHGPSCALEIDSKQNLDEIVDLLIELLSKGKGFINKESDILRQD